MKVAVRVMAGTLLLPCHVRLAGVVLLALLTGCVAESTTPPGESHSIQFDWPARGVPQLDLLFVVDDTPAMTPYRDRLAGLGAGATYALGYYNGWGMPDLHLGVMTTSGGPLTMLSDFHNNDGSRRTSYTGTLSDAMTAALDVGVSSQAAPQPFAAIARALSNTDFTRADTDFMAIVITADDDHSLGSIDDYLGAMYEHTRHPAVSGVYPAGAPRLAAYLAGISELERTYVPVESTSYAGVFDLLVGSITDFWIPCFYDPIPEPAACSISMLDDAGHETVVPSCADDATGTCWQIGIDPQCGAQTIDLRGYARQFRPHLIGECVSK